LGLAGSPWDRHDRSAAAHDEKNNVVVSTQITILPKKLPKGFIVWSRAP
jgi:hypothetical protein